MERPKASLPRHDRVLPFFVWFAYLFWAGWLTFPLVTVIFSHIPVGQEPAATVPLFNLWTLQRNIDQLMSGYPTYWNAPIFVPVTGAFAFSDPQPLTALLAAPVVLASRSALAGYNIIVILFLTLNGWFTFWLLRTWEISVTPAFLAGMMMQSMPFVAQEMGVLQLLALFGLLWILLFLSRALRECAGGSVRWSTIIGLGLGMAVTFFSCSYYAIFSVVIIPLAALLLPLGYNRRLLSICVFNKASVWRLVVVGGIVLGTIGLFGWTQYRILQRNNLTRSPQTIYANSASPEDYTRVLDRNLVYGQLLGIQSSPGQHLFPGFVLLMLAAGGLVAPMRPWLKWYLLAAISFTFLLSLGPRLQFFGWFPYPLIRESLPGFAQLRSPFRLAALVQMHLILLAAFGLAAIQRRFARAGIGLLIVLAGLVLAESAVGALPLQAVSSPQQQTGWQLWLNQQPDTPNVVMLPFASSSSAASFEQTVAWMLESRYFQGKMANGYSGFFPAHHRQLRVQMNSFPSSDSIELLRQIDVDYVIIDPLLAGAPRDVRVRQFLPAVYHDPSSDVTIYTLNPLN
jgi:hypothetical protein